MSQLESGAAPAARSHAESLAVSYSETQAESHAANAAIEPQQTASSILVTVLMPCLNEARTLAACIQQAHAGCQAALATRNVSRVVPASGSEPGSGCPTPQTDDSESTLVAAPQFSYEILIADNGSSDGSPEIATANGARVVHIEQKGYGAALRGGIEAARGKYIVMGDSDCSYDFGEVPRFLDKLEEGYDLVMGNRFAGGIMPGAMPWHHRYIGNPVLSGLGRLLYGTPCRDWHCGLRAFNREKVNALNLESSGMEYASELVLRASQSKLACTEIPVTLHADGRGHPSHMRSFRDGLRHLRLLVCNKSLLQTIFILIAVVLLGVGSSYYCRKYITAFFGGPVIYLEADTTSKLNARLTLHNVTFSPVTVVGARVSCQCLIQTDYPFSVGPFGSKVIELENPPQGSIIQFYVDKASSPIEWRF